MKRNNVVLLNDNKYERMFKEIFRGHHRFFNSIDISPVDCFISLSDKTERAFEINTVKQDLKVDTLLLASNYNYALDGLINSRVTYIDLPELDSVLDMYKLKHIQLGGDNVEFWFHFLCTEIHSLEVCTILCP